MISLDDTGIHNDSRTGNGNSSLNHSRTPNAPDKLEVVNPAGRRTISHAFHDIDGTHSLIRDWPPVMSRCLHTAIWEGLPSDFDSPENIERASRLVSSEELPETDRFCVESAGLSALTQMEWAVRRGVEERTIRIPGHEPSPEILADNSDIVRRIWRGEELFETSDNGELKRFVEEKAVRLHRLYAEVLNRSSRDRNLAQAYKEPGRWRVPGALEFMTALFQAGVSNYFVTGAVVSRDEAGRPEGGIYEEAVALGFEIGEGLMVESVAGSHWDRKLPKIRVMKELCRDLGLDPQNVLVVGDGRSEIEVGVAMGAVTMSRLPEDASRSREIHRELGTNYIVPEFDRKAMTGLMPQLETLWKSEEEI